LSNKKEDTRIPFEAWASSLRLDREKCVKEAAEEFARAAALFFESGQKLPRVSRALFEYSTLMDAFARIEKARALRAEAMDYDASLAKFAEANEILRATIHFGFLSSYVSACVTLEVASELDEQIDDKFQAYKNAIALLEQSKLALSLRDERHVLMKRIDAMLKFSIEGAVRTESVILSLQGMDGESMKKQDQADVLHGEFIELEGDSDLARGYIDYFPVDDPKRATNGAFVVSYPDAESIWLLNVGTNSALLNNFAGQSLSTRIEPGESLSFPMKEIPKGKIRVGYSDLVTKLDFDEGCIFII